MTPNSTEVKGAAGSAKILVVEDHEEYRRLVCSVLRDKPEFQVAGEASDGLEAIQQATKLQPDLILLDVGLPRLNGIAAVQRIREASPNSKVLFLSQESSIEVVQKALELGGHGYLLKSDAAGNLLLAIDAVLRGQQFVSRSLGLDPVPKVGDERAAGRGFSSKRSNRWPPTTETAHGHLKL